jgi:hypothetical protein
MCIAKLPERRVRDIRERYQPGGGGRVNRGEHQQWWLRTDRRCPEGICVDSGRLTLASTAGEKQWSKCRRPVGTVQPRQ